MEPASPVAQALREGLAAILCVVAVGLLHLEHGNLAVWTSHMVMSQIPFTIFQKAFERTLGRGVGILMGWWLVQLARDQPFLILVLEVVPLFVVFYLYFAGHLAYTFLNAGLLMVAMVEVSYADPATAGEQGYAMFQAVLTGAVSALVVTWLTFGEREVRIHPEGQPLFPIRGEWVNHTLMLVVSVMLTQVATRLFGLPASQSVISVMIVGVMPDLHTMIRKSEMRLLGLLLGAGWAAGMTLVLSFSGHFPVYLAFLFLGMFLAAYWAKVDEKNAYIGVQMGLVLPLVAVVPLEELGSLSGAGFRLEGVLVAIAASLVVAAAWPTWNRPVH